MSEGYVDAGKLEIEVVADTRGFTKDLRTKVEAASKGVEAEVGVKVDPKDLRERIRAVVAEDSAGVAANVGLQLDTDTLAARLRAAVAEAQAGVSATIPVGAGGDGLNPASTDEETKATLSLAQAKAQLLKVMGEARKTTIANDAAQQALTKVEKAGGKETDAYRKASILARQAMDERTDAVHRTRDAIRDMVSADTLGGSRPIEAEVALHAAKARAELVELTRPREVDVKVDVDKKGTAKSSASKLAKGISSVLGGMVVPAFTAMIGGAVIGLTGLVGALGSVLAAAAPAAGVIGLLPAAIGLLGVSIAPVILGLGGLGKAMKAISLGDAKKLQAAMKNLSPEARKLVLALALIRPEWEKLKKAVQDNFLQGMSVAVKNLAGNYLPLLKKSLSDVAGSWNLAFRDTAQILNTTKNVSSMRVALGLLTKAAGSLGEAGGLISQSFLDLFVTGAPFIPRMTEAIQQWVISFSNLVSRSRESGAMTRFFERAVDTATQLGHIIRDLTVGVFHFFKAGSESGRGMLDTLERTAARFREITGTPEKQAQFKKFFEDTRLIAAGLAQTIGYISQKLAVVGGLFNRLPDPVKRVLSSVLLIGGALGWIGSKLAPLVTAFGTIGTALEGVAVGPLLAVGAVVLAIAGALFYAYTTSKQFRDMVQTGFTTIKGIISDAWNTVKPIFQQWAAIFREKIKPAIDDAIKVFSEKVTPAFKEVKRIYESDVKPALTDLVKKFKDAEPEMKKMATAVGAVIRGIGRFSGSATFAGIVSGAKIAAGGIMVLIKIIEWSIDAFKRTVDFISAAPGRIKDVWEGFKGFWTGLWDGIKTGASKVIDFFKGIGEKVGSGLSTLGDKVKSGFNTALDFVKGIPGKVTSGLSSLAATASKPFVSLWDRVKEFTSRGISGMVSSVVQIPLNMLAGMLNGAAALIRFFTGLWDKVSSAVRTGVEATVSFVRALPGRIVAAVQALGEQLASWASTAWGHVKSAFTTGVNATVAFFKALPGRVVGAVQALGGAIASWASSAWNRVKSAFTTGVNATVAFFRSLPGKVVSAVSALGGAIASWASSAWNRARAAFVSGVNATVAFFRGLPGKIGSALAGLGGSLKRIGTQIVDGLVSGIRSGVNRVKDAARNLASAIPGPIQKLLGISSPSKVTAQIGRYVVAGLVQGLTGSRSQIHAAATRMAGYLRQALGARASGLTGMVNADVAELSALVNRRNAVITSLAAAQSRLNGLLSASATVRAQIAAKVRDTFSILSQGGTESIDAMTARLKKALSAATDFAANVAALKARGLASALLQQLADAGPVDGASTAKTLASATAAQIANLNSLAGQLGKVADNTGATVANSLYAAGIHAARGLVAGLTAERKNIEATMLDIAKGMQAAIKRALGIHSPSTVMAQLGAFTAQGLEQGLLSGLGGVQGAARSLAEAVAFTPGQLLPVTARAAAGLGARGAAGTAIPAQRGAAGTDIDVNVYPQAGQSEREIGLVAAREVVWGMTP